jgi:hypothetical protein
MSSNDPFKTEDHYNVVRHTGEHSQASVVVQQITSEEGPEINMLTMQRKDDKWT